MSTRQFRTIHDFMRHRRDVELVCRCGHKAVLSRIEVATRFNRAGWPISLGSALRRFRCSKCGAHPERVGPMER